MNNITIFFVSLKCKQKNKTLCYPTTKLLKFSIWQTTSAFFNETVKKHSIDDTKRHRNKPSRLSDSEIMTILIMFHMGGFRCLKHFYVNYICKHSIAAYCYFPKKPSISIEHYHDKQLVLF